jgi:hypothetical protein
MNQKLIGPFVLLVLRLNRVVFKVALVLLVGSSEALSQARALSSPETVDTMNTVAAKSSDISDFCGTVKIDRKASLKNALKVLPGGGRYDINSSNWPTCSVEKGALKVSIKKGTSMCTSASATMLLQQVADTLKAGNIPLTPDIVGLLSNKKSLMKYGVNGNTYAPAILVNLLGGVSDTATDPAGIKALLARARPGDQFIYSRAKGGHATSFVGMKGDQACFISSQKRTNGMAEACVPVSSLRTVAISRLPGNPQRLAAHLKALAAGRPLVYSQKASPPATPPLAESTNIFSRAASSVAGMLSGVWQKLTGLISRQDSANKVKGSDVVKTKKFPYCANMEEGGAQPRPKNNPGSTGSSTGQAVRK